VKPGVIVAERFEIERFAGEGGMGVVYRARDVATGDPVALKVFRGRAGTPGGDRFLREARVLADLRHPGVVRYVAHGTLADGGSLYMAMDWLEGEDLSQRLARGPLGPDETALFGHRVAEALAAAHARGVVHRDVKPSNLFLLGGDVGRPVVLDFGVARLALSARAATRTGAVLGTPGYMAPEQARGERDVDARADVFSLGCVLFECLTGRAAFVADHVLALLAKVLLEDAPRVREIAMDVPEALDSLVSEMLAKDPGARPADGSETAARLAEIAAGVLELPTRLGRPSSAPMGIGKGELALVSVVVAAPPRGGADAESLGPTLTPELSRELLDRARLATAVFGASVEPLADGSMVAILGGSGVATDQAARAARAALALAAALPAGRIALATGRGLRGTRLPVGEAIDRAVALARGAGSGVGVDEVTAGLVGPRFDLRAGARGFELHGERGEEPVRTLLGRPTPFVGRDLELRTLLSAWEACRAEPAARAVLVVGGAGSGKTRLRRELLTRLEGSAFETWTARGDVVRAGSPFGMLAQAIQQAAGVRAGEPIEKKHRKLRARLARNVGVDDLGRVSEFLGELVGAPAPHQDESIPLRAARRDPILMGDQMRRAWEDFLAAECDAGPVLLLLEDLHWGDLPSVGFVDAALRQLQDRPFFVLALARPEVHDLFPRLWAGRATSEIRLGDLSRAASERLAREVLGAQVPDGTVRGLAQRAAGNAFYLEELLRAHVEGGREALQSLPGTVLAMAQARITSLDDASRRLLRAASVFGETFWRGGLVRLLALGPADLDHGLGDLVAREALVRRTSSRFADEAEYGFRHAIVREAAYGMLTEADRTLGHRLAAEWLESAGEGDAMSLAEHFERGGAPDRAVRFWLRAADQALGGNDFVEAAQRADRGIRCGASGETKGALLLVSAEAHRWRAQIATAKVQGTEALAHLRPGSTLWWNASIPVVVACGQLGHHDELEAISSILLATSPDADAAASCAVALFRAEAQADQAGRRALSDALFDAGEARLARAGGDPIALGWSYIVRGTRARRGGNVGALVGLMERALETFEASGDLRTACIQRTNLADGASEIGCWEDAERHLRDALAMSDRLGLLYTRPFILANLADVVVRQGAISEGLALADEALAHAIAAGNRRFEAASRTCRAHALWLRGDFEQAEAEASRALRTAEAAPPMRPLAGAFLSRACLSLGRFDDALAAAVDAARAFADYRPDNVEALVALVLAEALRAAGREGEAGEVIRRAKETVLRRAEPLDPEWRRGFLERVEEHARILHWSEAQERR